MRPIRVEFQAFGPYVGHEKVDFEAISSKGLFLICGKTGIGKTMILDAMTFALFGKSSGNGRNILEAMRCTNAEHNTDTFVLFEFENHGEFYRFERRLERKRKNLSASYNVAQKDDDGIWQPLLENAKEKAVNEKATEIIGLDYEQFRQVIILPQGQFERLLTSNSDEKEKILTNIFGEDKWQAIADRFYAKAEKRKNELKGISEKIQNSLSEEGCDTIPSLELIVERKKNSIEELDEKHKKEDHDSIIKEQRGLLTIARRFGDLHKAEAAVAELEAKKDERDAWEATLKDAKRADNVRPFIENEKREMQSLQNRKKEEDSAKNSAAEKEKACEEASEKHKIHNKKEKDIEDLKAKRMSYESKRKDYEGLEEAENELKAKEKIAKNALDKERRIKEESESFSEKIILIQKEFNALRDEHDELLNAYLASITGELASELKTGMPCPVCGSTEHPHKAHRSENSITREMVDLKKKASDKKYKKLQEQIEDQNKVKKQLEECHAEVERANNEVTNLSAQLENKKKNLVEGIPDINRLEEVINELRQSVEEYGSLKEKLQEAEKLAQEAYIESKTKISSAEKETKAAERSYLSTKESVEKALKDNGFQSREEAEGLMLGAAETEELSSGILKYDANIKAAKDNLKSIKAELKGRKEPDEEKCQEILDNASAAKDEYIKTRAELKQEYERLEKKVKHLKKEGRGIEERIREADEIFAFAKRLRGDSGTGLQRYVLGIMFSSVVTAANKMLEMVHDGRYRLYRSDEKAQGTNKRGLELKVFDKNSEEHEGRFVSTLSGGEKFLASLALSIGLSTVAQKSGIKIEALFIDEGFGSLDEDSIGDAMRVLNSIQEANGLVGIISHVQLLQDQIPSKLRVEEDTHGSHIVQTVG